VETERLANEIESKFDFIQDEVEVRIESLKKELDEMGAKLIKQMTESKNNLKK
jgi:hypothetical protein